VIRLDPAQHFRGVGSELVVHHLVVHAAEHQKIADIVDDVGRKSRVMPRTSDLPRDDMAFVADDGFL